MLTDVGPQKQSSLDVWREIHNRRRHAHDAREIDAILLEYSLLLRIGSIAAHLLALHPSERSSLTREARYYLEEDRNYIDLTRMPVFDYELRNMVFEFHKKLSVPVGCVVFVVFAIPLVLSVSRRVYGLLIGIATATVYWVMLVLAHRTALQSSSISAGLIAWVPNFCHTGDCRGDFASTTTLIHLTSALLLQRMVLRSFVPVFVGAAVMFSLAAELADVLPNLYRYFARRVPLSVILRVALLYYPKCLVLSLPAALLFSVTYTMGDFYAHNELIAVFSSGTSLRQLTIPLIVIGLFFSVLVFFFEDIVVVRTLRMKNQLYREAVGIEISLSDTNVVVTSADGMIVFHAATYDQESSQLTRTVIVELDSAHRLVSRMDANSVRWSGHEWIFFWEFVDILGAEGFL